MVSSYVGEIIRKSFEFYDCDKIKTRKSCVSNSLRMPVNNYAFNYFAMIGHAEYAHQKKKRFMRVKPCRFYM